MNRINSNFDITKIEKWINMVWPSCDWIQNPNGPGRKYSKHKEVPLYADLFHSFGLKSERLEPIFECFIGHHFQDGAYTQEHQDKNLDGLIHTRINVMIKKPPIGGNPIISGKELQINQGDIWLSIAGKERHASTPINGGERIIVSFGGLVKESSLHKYYKLNT
jgi:hypothetical protein